LIEKDLNTTYISQINKSKIMYRIVSENLSDKKTKNIYLKLKLVTNLFSVNDNKLIFHGNKTYLKFKQHLDFRSNKHLSKLFDKTRLKI